MTVPELVNQVMSLLQQFYVSLPRRDWKRDEGFLVNAIGTYGWECAQRGWEFDVEFIYRDLCGLLRSFKRSGAEVKWMPNYLQHAIRQHLREHAEELNARSKSERGRKSTAAQVGSVLEGIKPVVVLEMPAVEVLGSLHKDLKALRRRTAAERRVKGAEERKQKVLPGLGNGELL